MLDGIGAVPPLEVSPPVPPESDPGVGRYTVVPTPAMTHSSTIHAVGTNIPTRGMCALPSSRARRPTWAISSEGDDRAAVPMPAHGQVGFFPSHAQDGQGVRDQG